MGSSVAIFDLKAVIVLGFQLTITNLPRGRLLLVINNLLQRQLSSIQQEILKVIRTYKSMGIL